MQQMLNKLFLTTIATMATMPLLAAVSGEQPPAPDIRVLERKPSDRPRPSVDTVSRGQLLYENHCTRCHASTLHVQQARRADSLKVLQGWVIRWSGEEKLNWGGEEITDVVDYLNRRYYKFPPPSDAK